MPVKNLRWIYLILLSLVWGSSFILIKKGLTGLSPLQLGSFRIIFAAIFLVVVGFKSLLKIKSSQWKLIVLTGFLGSFFLIYLFAFAETEIDSAVASILNATTPLMTLIFGVVFFRMVFTRNKVTGIVLGLAGALGLIFSGAQVNPDQDYFFSGLVVIAAGCYAVNVNIIKRYMHDISALGIAAGNFLILLLPAIVVLYFTGFAWENVTSNPTISLSLTYVLVLGVVGTGIALIIFNRLIQISDPVFSSSVTYTIPVIGLAWGLLDGEVFTLSQIISTLIILAGVFMVNRNRKVYSKIEKPTV